MFVSCDVVFFPVCVPFSSYFFAPFDRRVSALLAASIFDVLTKFSGHILSSKWGDASIKRCYVFNIHAVLCGCAPPVGQRFVWQHHNTLSVAQANAAMAIDNEEQNECDKNALL